MGCNIKLDSILTSTFCMIGLIIQTYQISKTYLSFETTSYVQVLLPGVINVPSLSICWKIQDLMNLSYVEHQFKTKFSRDDPLWGNKYNDFIINVTVSQVMDSTPTPDVMFEECVIRFPKHLTATKFYGNECATKFVSQKYLQREYICYKFTPIFKSKELLIQDYSLSPDYVGTIFRFQLKLDLFEPVIAFTSFVHDEATSEYYDAIFSFEIIDKNVNDKSHPNVGLTYQSVERNYLEAPYDTHCVMVKPPFEAGSEIRFSNINNQTMKMFGRVIPMIAIPGDAPRFKDYKLIQMNLLRNTTFIREFKNILNRFKSSKGCHIKYYITTPTIRREKKIRFTLYWPKYPSIKIDFNPRENFIDYLIYLGSSIGIWFGLSIFASIKTLIGGVCGSDQKHNSMSHDHLKLSAELAVARHRLTVHEIEMFKMKREIHIIKTQR